MTTRPLRKITTIGCLERQYEQSIPSARRDAQSAVISRRQADAVEQQVQAETDAEMVDKYPALKNGA